MPEKLVKVRREYRWTVKRRLRILAYVKACSLKAASRHFDLDRKTIREWRDRCHAAGMLGLVPRYPAQRPSRLPPETLRLIEHARRELEYGAARTQVWLLRVHQIRLPRATISLAFRRLGLPRLPRRRKRAVRPRQLRLFEKPNPGDCVQIDVKYVKVHGQRAYQYTALDDCTRVRVLRLYRHLGLRSALSSLPSCAGGCHSRSVRSKPIMAPSSSSTSCWPSSKPGSATGTSGRVALNRTAKWSAVTASTTRSSGAAISSRRSTALPRRCRVGSAPTISSDSHWPSAARLPPRS